MNAVLRVAGKNGQKVVAVFAGTGREAALAVGHVREGGVELPIHLYCREMPEAAVGGQCAGVTVNANSVALFARAQRQLWPFWVALGVAAWTGRRGDWTLKAAPFFFPPFRVLVLNENNDFFSGSVGGVAAHVWRKKIGAIREAAIRGGHLAKGYARLGWVWVGLAADFLWSWLKSFRFTRARQILRGALAFPFAYVGQHYSPLSRFVFRRMQGEETLNPKVERGSVAGMATIRYKGREWPREALEETLAKTDTRWLAFVQEGVDGPIEDLPDLFADGETFAVSRQNAFRGWQKLLFPTAPFQTLQENECARVFAPYSDEIIVDRAKLLALGIPRLSTSGSNWYLLFWKAAAAGWNSYSVGGTKKIGELPGVPFYEAQFVHALLLEPELARLKPRSPLLARGNVTRWKVGGKGFRPGLPRVLILSPYLPYPLSHGGAVRIFSLCQALAHGVDFVLVCFREKNDQADYGKLDEVFRDVYVVAVDERNNIPDAPAQVSGYESGSMRALIADLCARFKIDILQVEYTQMALYREAAPQVPAILVEHDITFTLYRQLADRNSGAAAEEEYRRWLRFETGRLRAFDQVWTMSDHDRAQAIEAGSDAANTITVPNGVDLRRFGGLAPRAGEAREILFIGSFRHLPNFLAFEELRDRVMPFVWVTHPGLRLTVVAGPEHEKHWPGRHEFDARITVHGFVADVSPLYGRCDLVVVPLPVSAGTNVKVIEALAAERAVVSTPVGCVGLELEDGSEIAIRELGPGFAAAITELASDEGKRLGLAKRGKDAAEARFSWSGIAGAAMVGYGRLLKTVSEAGDPERDRRE